MPKIFLKYEFSRIFRGKPLKDSLGLPGQPGSVQEEGEFDAV